MIAVRNSVYARPAVGSLGAPRLGRGSRLRFTSRRVYALTLR